VEWRVVPCFNKRAKISMDPQCVWNHGSHHHGVAFFDIDFKKLDLDFGFVVCCAVVVLAVITAVVVAEAA
jgi:hypothetical protein